MAVSASRNQIVLLTGLVALLVAVVGYQVRGWRAAPAATSAGGARGTAATAKDRSEQPLPVPDVRLESLETARPDPASNRNLFREQPKAPPPPPPVAARPVVPAPDPNAPPPGPPPPPPIALKFIGIVQAGGRSVAVLRDGADILYGREGELVDGRYRIIKINVESVEVSYADGRGRRVIPLTG